MQWGLATPSGTGSQGDPGQRVPSPIGHNPTGAGNRVHQQLPTRRDRNQVLGTSRRFSQEQKKREPETRLEVSYSMGPRSIQAAGQGADTPTVLLKAGQHAPD